MTNKICKEPGCLLEVRCKELCSYHYTKSLKAQNRIGKLYKCKKCNKEFRSSSIKLFCSFDCYLLSDLRKENDKNQSERLKKEKKSSSCLNCQKELLLLPHQIKRKRRFCGQNCYRLYLADRFDRWVANPKDIETIQCFDDFLTQDNLYCLIEDCDWSGDNLSQHVNRDHGMTSEQFKKLVGFNKTTGLVSRQLRDKLEKNAKRLREEGILVNGTGESGKGIAKPPFRKEHIEHIKKARAERNV